MGVKGIGEAATIGSTPAIANAVLDALSSLGVRHLDLPLRAEKVWRAIRMRIAMRAIDRGHRNHNAVGGSCAASPRDASLTRGVHLLLWRRHLEYKIAVYYLDE